MARPLNYTTAIPARRTAAECTDLLAEAGADHVSLHLTDRQPTGITFTLRTAGGRRDYALPVDAAAMAAVLSKELRADRPHVSAAKFQALLSAEHALDVAWRVLRDWLEAQLALIAADMAKLDQVMLPYLEIGQGRSVYDLYLEQSGALQLEAPGD